MAIEKIGWGFGRCNMSCEHCYNASSMAATIPTYGFDILRRVADKLCPRIKDINFGTGELGCNKNALRLVRYIRTTYPRVDMSLTTNGYTVMMMDPAEVKSLLNDVDVSIDFPSKERHNSFRRHPKAWEWAIGALETLQYLRLQHTVVVCITAKTTDADLLDLLDLAERYEANLRLSWYREVGRGENGGLRLLARRAWEVLELLAPRVIFNSLDSVFAGPMGIPCQPCPAGSRSARIHQDGSVTSYPFLKGEEWSAGNVLEDAVTLETIEKSEAFRRLREREMSVQCRDCQFVSGCQGGCVTRAILHSGGLDKSDDYCPVSAGLLNVVERLRDKVVVQKQGNLVHDGYLCTTIMRPRAAGKELG